jgi:hypothetical protein
MELDANTGRAILHLALARNQEALQHMKAKTIGFTIPADCADLRKSLPAAGRL